MRSPAEGEWAAQLRGAADRVPRRAEGAEVAAPLVPRQPPRLARGLRWRIRSGNEADVTQQSALRVWRRGPFKVLFAHHRDHEAHHVVVLMVLAAALSLIATIFVAGAAGYVAVASHLRHANTYWFPFAIAGAVAAQIGYTFAYREVANVGRGVKLGALRAGAIVAAGFGMFIPRGGFAVDIEALEDLGVPRDEARVRVLGLGSLEYAVLATGALICAIFLLLNHADAQRAVTLSWTIGVPAGTALAPAQAPSRRFCPSRSSGWATALHRRSSRSSPTASSTSGYRSAPRPSGSTTCSGEHRKARTASGVRRSRR